MIMRPVAQIMNKPTSLLIVLTLGICLGGLVRFVFPHERSESYPSTGTHAGKGTAAAPAYPFSITFPPSVGEVLRAEGFAAAELLSRYLKEANLDEVLALMESIADGKSQIADLMWMVQMRGLELDPERVLEWTLARPDQSRWVQSLFDSWMRLDPRAALEAGIQGGSDLRQAALRATRNADPDKAIEALRELHPHGVELKDLELQQRIASAKGNYPDALQDVLEIADPRERIQNLNSLVEAWAKEDPMKALQWAELQEDLPGRDGLFATILAELGESQPTLALTKLGELPVSARSRSVGRDVVEAWANRDSNAALDWLKNLPASPQRDLYYTKVATHLPKDPKELLTYISEQKINIERGRASDLVPLVSKAAHQLIEESPEDALLLLESLDLAYPDTYQKAAVNWVKNDPEGAAERAMQLSQTSFGERFQENVIKEWGNKAPMDVARYLQTQGLLDQGNLVAPLAQAWASQDPNGALEWMDHLSGDARTKAFISALEQLAQTDPKTALQHFHEIEAEQEIQPSLPKGVFESSVETWRQQDPQELMEWLTMQPEEAAMDKYLTESSQEWVARDPSQASEWIAAMDNGRPKDMAIVGMVRAITSDENPNKDFTAAETWIREVSDPVLQEQVRAELGQQEE